MSAPCVNPVGWVSTHHKLIPTQLNGVAPARFFGPAKPGLGPAAELLFGIAQKVTKKASPEPRCFLRCSQRAGPAQIARWRAAARGGLMVRVYDRPLLRSSARAEGAVRTDV